MIFAHTRPTGLYDELSRFFISTPRNQATKVALHRPVFDVYTLDDHYQVAVDMPGVAQDAIQLNLQDDLLTIHAERQAPSTRSSRPQQRAFGQIEQQLRLPQDADSQGIQAELKEGVLQVTIPKHAKSQPRDIPINA